MLNSFYSRGYPFPVNPLIGRVAATNQQILPYDNIDYDDTSQSLETSRRGNRMQDFDGYALVVFSHSLLSVPNSGITWLPTRQTPLRWVPTVQALWSPTKHILRLGRSQGWADTYPGVQACQPTASGPRRGTRWSQGGRGQNRGTRTIFTFPTTPSQAWL